MNERPDEAGLAPISRENIQGRVYAELREALMTGAFVPGRAMSIQALADTFGTSTMPVREALRRLVAEQALQIQRNRSVMVPLLTEPKLNDLLRVRKVVEGSAVEWATYYVDDALLARLRELCDQVRAAAEEGRTRDYLVRNREFRFAIYERAGSAVILPVIESLWLQIGPFLNLLYFEGRLDSNIEYFEEVIAALRARDATAARDALDRDMEVAAGYILDRMIRSTRGD